MMLRRWWIVLLVLLAPLAQAVTPSTGPGQAPSTGPGQGLRAFLDRSQVSLGDTVTLNLQSDGSIGNPDLSPLQQDFEVLGSSRSSSVSIVNGKTTSTEQLGIALKPLRAGTLTIPALTVGGATTQPLTLQVDAAPSGGGKVGDPAFMQANVQPGSPYVGQQTVYTVRLFYLPGVNGALGDPSADGARLIPLDRDHRYVVNRDGYAYKVIERSWALIPQRSGRISVQGPVFEGQQLGPGFPNAWFNNPNALLNNPNALLNSPLHGFGGSVRTTAPVVQLDARAAPASAGKPWLPARGVRLTMTGLPADGKLDAATPLTVTLTVNAIGQPADALPEPELPQIAGARVYPDQTRDSTDDSGQWLQGTRTRNFAIVPDRNGALTLPAITLDWWNVTRDSAEQASVPAHTLAVSGVVASPSAQIAPAVGKVAGSSAGHAAPAASEAPAGSGTAAAASAGWREIALASLALWVVAVIGAVWWFLRGRKSRGKASLANPVPAAGQHDPGFVEVDARVLQKRALAAARGGDAAACEHVLLAWARTQHPAITHAGSLRDALADPAQRAALDALQRARWQNGAAVPACSAVAQAFAPGFVWRDDGGDTPRADDQALPPLYPSA